MKKKKKKKEIPMLKMNLKQLEKTDTIKWVYRGLVGVICKEKIANAIQGLKDRQNFSNLYSKNYVHTFYWEDVTVKYIKPKRIGE